MYMYTSSLSVPDGPQVGLSLFLVHISHKGLQCDYPRGVAPSVPWELAHCILGIALSSDDNVMYASRKHLL